MKKALFLLPTLCLLLSSCDMEKSEPATKEKTVIKERQVETPTTTPEQEANKPKQ